MADGIINRSNGNPLFLQRNKHRQESIYNGIFAIQQQGFHVSVIISTEMMNIEKHGDFLGDSL